MAISTDAVDRRPTMRPLRTLARVLPSPVRRRLTARLVRLAWDFRGSEFGKCAPAEAFRTFRKGYDIEDAACEAIPQVVGATQLSYERLVTLYQQVAYLERNRLPGALVECGVWRGGAAAMMALANLAEGSERRMLHLFDSFKGMPEPDLARDGEEALRWAGQRGDGSLVSTGVNVASPEEVRSLIIGRIGYPASSVVIHRGWFQDTLPVARPRIGPIALLRVDADWYESTLVALEHLFDLVIPRGVVVIDDYGAFEGCRRATDEFLARHAPDAYLHHIDYTGRYFIKT
jgi:O-methyltransferase